MSENKTPKEAETVKTKVSLPKSVTSSKKVAEELSILRDFASGMSEADAFKAFQKRRENTSKESTETRFKVYCKCAARKAGDYGFDAS